MERLEYTTGGIPVRIPERLVAMLKKELDIEENEVEKLVVSLIERVIAEHIGETNSSVFTESETRELEENLKGLGYI